MFFSKEEINKLKAFFEQLHIDTREYNDDQFKCSDEKDNAVFTFSWEGSTWGWHDESWYDIAKFTVSKTPFAMPEIDLKNTDTYKDLGKRMYHRLRSIEEASSVCHIVTLEEFDHYTKVDAVLFADGFLDIPERVKITCSFRQGEW